MVAEGEFILVAGGVRLKERRECLGHAKLLGQHLLAPEARAAVVAT